MTTVLVVEDENIVAKDIANRLRHLGYQVCGMAGSGEEAIRMAESEHPDLVLWTSCYGAAWMEFRRRKLSPRSMKFR